MVSKDTKLLLLKKIEENKNILFGAFNDKLTKQNKSDAWKEIFKLGQSCGAFNGKEWSYIRDVFWPNIRKTTMVSIILNIINVQFL